MSEKETVEVTAKIPKRLIDLLEEQNYFDWDKEHFLLVAVRDFISAEISELDHDEAKKLYAKYGKDVDCLTVEITKTLKVVQK